MITKNSSHVIAAFVFVLVGGCERACTPVKQPNAPVNVKSEPVTLSKFHLHPKAIFDKTKTFSYRSELTITLNRDGQSSESKESIEIVGDDQRILLKKRIDPYHFIELYSENFDAFMIKTQNGSWHSGRDNKPMYQALLNDGLNTVAWLIDEFSLQEAMLRNSVEKGVVNTYFVRGAQLAQHSPFYLQTLTPILSFFSLERSQVDCEVSLDRKTDIPVFARCDAAIIGSKDHWIKINATMTLDTRGLAQSIETPVVKDDEPILVPVNIGPRFRDLLGLDSNSG